jgi:predicted ATPase with chaperone activity
MTPGQNFKLGLLWCFCPRGNVRCPDSEEACHVLPPQAEGGGAAGECSAAVRERVVAARDTQRTREDAAGVRTNATLTPQLMAKYCCLDAAGLRLLAIAVRRLGLTA